MPERPENRLWLQLQSKLNDTLQVIVPFVWQDLKEGELVFRESEQGRAGEQAYSCTVNLDLERAGKVSAHVLLQAGSVHVTFSGENERFMKLLDTGIGALREQCEASGIKLGEISIRYSPAVDFAPSRAGALNIRV